MRIEMKLKQGACAMRPKDGFRWEVASWFDTPECAEWITTPGYTEAIRWIFDCAKEDAMEYLDDRGVEDFTKYKTLRDEANFNVNNACKYGYDAIPIIQEFYNSAIALA